MIEVLERIKSEKKQDVSLVKLEKGINFMKKTYCFYYKETDGMRRWDAKIKGAPLEMYIYKWRVPKPYPSRISVEIFNRAEFSQSIYSLNRKETNTNPKLCYKPITAEVVFLEDHTRTAKYDPVLGKGKREIGNPYIPHALLSDPPPTRLVLVVNWE